MVLRRDLSFFCVCVPQCKDCTIPFTYSPVSDKTRLAASGHTAVNPQSVLPSSMFGRFWRSSPKLAHHAS